MARKPLNPSSGTLVTISLPADVLRKIDDHCNALGRSRSGFVREACIAAIDSAVSA